MGVGAGGGGLKKARHTTQREPLCFTEVEGSSQEQPSPQQRESLLCSKLSWESAMHGAGKCSCVLQYLLSLNCLSEYFTTFNVQGWYSQSLFRPKALLTCVCVCACARVCMCACNCMLVVSLCLHFIIFTCNADIYLFHH